VLDTFLQGIVYLYFIIQAVCMFRRSWRIETAKCCVLVYLGRVRVDTGRVRYLRVVKNFSLCDLISVVQVLDLLNIVYNCFSNYLCVEFFICVENSSSNRFRILSCKFSETPIHPPLGASLVLSKPSTPTRSTAQVEPDEPPFGT